MNSKSKAPSRLTAEITELATAMHANGTIDPATFKKITMRQFGEVDVATSAPLSADDVRAIRQQAHKSQAVFAKHLNLTRRLSLRSWSAAPSGRRAQPPHC